MEGDASREMLLQEEADAGRGYPPASQGRSALAAGQMLWHRERRLLKTDLNISDLHRVKCETFFFFLLQLLFWIQKSGLLQ